MKAMPAMRPHLLTATLALATSLACADDLDQADTTDAVGAPSLTLTASFATAATTGQNHLRLTLEDGQGAGVVGAAVAVVPTMPMHGHGSTETPVVTEIGDGEYDAFPVTFQMPGAWLVAIDATLGQASAHLDLDVTVP